MSRSKIEWTDATWNPVRGCTKISPGLDGIRWVIVGGESGAGARPMKRAWVLSLRAQCGRARVPFFFKQWGGVQKKRAGREIDGQTYDAMPERSADRPATNAVRQALIDLADRASLEFQQQHVLIPLTKKRQVSNGRAASAK